MTRASISPATAADFDVVAALLEREHLPTAGLQHHLEQMLVARSGSRVVGCAALGLAGRHGVPAVYLLTTTAERFFPKFGFDVIDRADVPPGVTTSAEFTYACPSSAIVMRKQL